HRRDRRLGLDHRRRARCLDPRHPARGVPPVRGLPHDRVRARAAPRHDPARAGQHRRQGGVGEVAVGQARQPAAREPAARAGAREAMTPALDVRNLSLSFGGLKAVCDFSMALPPGGLYGLIGPNGAGKTTVFNLLTGVYKPDVGSVSLAGTRIDGKKPSMIARAGMARTFQNIRLFGELSVLDNVKTAAGVRTKSGLFRTLFRTPLHVAEERAIHERSLELLDVLGIAHRRDEQAKSSPYGDQRRVEI